VIKSHPRECATRGESGNVQNSDCVISSDSVDREITESSEVQQLRVELYKKDYRRSIWDTADGSTCVIVNCVSVRANVE
jgi:hypothetical protein